MNKYIAIIDRFTLVSLASCVAITWFCLRYGFTYDLNITLFSIAVVFPLVFTIREAFKRRDTALEHLSQFKSGLQSAHYAFEQSPKLSRGDKDAAATELCAVADDFLDVLSSDSMDNEAAEERINELIRFVAGKRKYLSNSATMKIIRFLQDVHESMENVLSIKRHGTPVSLRAYCLIFVFLFPIVFTPTIAYNLGSNPTWIIYTMSMLHGFVLISLYNVQSQMENPFDQIGLDDIQLHNFRMLPMMTIPVVMENGRIAD